MTNNTTLLTYGLGITQVMLFLKLQSMSEKISYYGPISFQQWGVISSFVLLAVSFFMLFHNLNTVRSIIFLTNDEDKKWKMNEQLFSKTVFLIAMILSSSLLLRFL